MQAVLKCVFVSSEKFTSRKDPVNPKEFEKVAIVDPETYDKLEFILGRDSQVSADSKVPHQKCIAVVDIVQEKVNGFTNNRVSLVSLTAEKVTKL